MSNFNANEFHLYEIITNENGKQSGSAFTGVIMGLVGCLGFIAAIVGYFLKIENTIDFMQQTIFFIGAATVLLGTRKLSEGNAFKNDVTKINNVKNDV